MTDAETSVCCLVLPLRECTAVLPAAAVAEVVPRPMPGPATSAPPWVVGTFRWRGCARALLALDSAMETGCSMLGPTSAAPPAIEGTHIAVLRPLTQGSTDIGGESQPADPDLVRPGLGVLLQRAPRVLLASRATLHPAPTPPQLPFVLAEAELDGSAVFIPDIVGLERTLAGLRIRPGTA